METKIVAITLMRKGSKRFLNKAMYPLFGIPLYMYTVEYARNLGYPYYLAHDYDNLYLPEFVNEIKRKPKYTGDKHKTCEEIKSYNLDADIYILLQVTSPFRYETNIMRLNVSYLEKNKNLQVVIGGKVLKDRYYYYKNGTANFKQKDRTDNGCNKKYLFSETGNFYIFRKEQLDKKHILDCNRGELDIQYSTPDIDIDTIKDINKIERAIYEL